MESVLITIILWVELVFFVVLFLYALPSLAKLLTALIKKEAQWPGDKHYAEPKNVSPSQYQNWYMKGDIPLFSGFILFLLGVMAAGALSLLVLLNTYNLQDTIRVPGWNLINISYVVIMLIGFYCATQLWKKLKYLHEFFFTNSILKKK